MIKLVVLYNPPADPEAFDRHYFSTHLEVVEKIPGLERCEVAKLASTDGQPSPYYLMAELYFADEAAMGQGMSSAEGGAAAADMANFAMAGASMLVGAVTEN